LLGRFDGTATANGTFCEALVAARADDEAVQLNSADFFMLKWNVS
jgi:hypothetical protein